MLLFRWGLVRSTTHEWGREKVCPFIQVLLHFFLFFIHLFFRQSIHSFFRSSVQSSSPFIHWLSEWVSEWMFEWFIHSFVPIFIFSLTCSLWFFPIWPGTKNRGRLRCPWLEEREWGGGGGLRRWGVMEGKISVTFPGTSKKWRNEAASSLSSCDFLLRQDVRHWCN